MKAVLFNENNLPSVHGFIAIRMEPTIVHAVCGPLKTISCQSIHKSKWAKLASGWQDYCQGKSALRYHHRSAWH